MTCTNLENVLASRKIYFSWHFFEPWSDLLYSFISSTYGNNKIFSGLGLLSKYFTLTWFRKKTHSDIYLQTWCKFKLLLYPGSNTHCMPDILSQTKACVLYVLIVLGAVELVMIRNVTIVEVVQPQIAYSTNKTGFVKNMILHCHTLQNFHWLSTFLLVTSICPNYRSVWSVLILWTDLKNSQNQIINYY